MTKGFLETIYDDLTPENAPRLYDDWAASYDAEVGENGYATPGRVATALAAHVDDQVAPVLDYGCGTGLSGHALRTAGFTVIDGMDPSAEMVRLAREKGIYRDLATLDIDDPAPVGKDAYPAIVAVGVIGPGAGPTSIFDILIAALPPSGLLSFSLNDHALADPAYEATLARWLDAGTVRLIFKEHGPHLPGKNIKSTVYIIEKV